MRTTNDASELLSPAVAISPYVNREPAILFVLRDRPLPAPTKQLAIAKRALASHDTAQIIAALERGNAAGRLRRDPARRLFLDRRLELEWLGSTRIL
ncbi:MAG: hypothetical protein HY700_13480 [Gemmatimonadetes bacterium]|nr:hypothetical protein [Gemmatimonadota bacterium]